MTNTEFDVLDELYFIQSYEYLMKSLTLSEDQLRSTLRSLLEKGWVTCYSSPTDEIIFESSNFEKEFYNYHYLANKKGLLAHNSNF